MGQESETAAREAAFADYQVNEALFAQAAPDAVFLHCLPAHRGLECGRSHRLPAFDNVRTKQKIACTYRRQSCIPFYLGESVAEESRLGLFGRSRHLDHHSVAQGKLPGCEVIAMAANIGQRED